MQQFPPLARRGRAPDKAEEFFHATTNVGAQWDSSREGMSHVGTEQAALERLGAGVGTMFRGRVVGAMANDPSQPISDDLANQIAGTPDEGAGGSDDTYDHLYSYYDHGLGAYYRNENEDAGSISAVINADQFDVEDTLTVHNREASVMDRATERVTTHRGLRGDWDYSGKPSTTHLGAGAAITGKFSEPRLFNVEETLPMQTISRPQYFQKSEVEE